MNSKRITELEGMRGLAALVVYAHHFVLLLFPSYYFRDELLTGIPSFLQLFATTPLGIILDGNLAVRFFFVHSGFILTYAYMAKPDDSVIKIILRSIGRYLRLTLPVLASILFAYLLMKYDLIFSGDIDTENRTKWASRYFNFEPNFLKALSQSLWGTYFNFSSSKTYNCVLWTIAIELKGSYLTYLLCSISAFMNKFIYSIALLITALLFKIESSYYCFFIGILLYHLYPYLLELKKKKSLTLTLFLVLVNLYFGGLKTFDHELYSYLEITKPYSSKIFWIFKTIGATALFLLTLQSGKLINVLNTKIFQYFGKISFSLYLLHFPLLASLSSYLSLKMNLHFLLNFSITSIVLTLISHLLYKTVDTKAIKINKWVRSRRLVSAS